MVISSNYISILSTLYELSRAVRSEKERKNLILTEVGSGEPSCEQKEKLQKITKEIAGLELQINLFSKDKIN